MEDTVCNNSSMEKKIKSLRKSVQQTKTAILDKLKKSEQRYKEEISAIEEGKKKTSLQKKLNRILKEQNILDNLSEDDIVKFALTTQQNLMVVAANPRMPNVVRMKARVASHKPLSKHLAKIKSKLQKAEESEDEEESENKEDSDSESSKPLDKMCVNNQIVKMRKKVKQAKVYIIHKLTRNITKLRSVKGKNEEKCQRKADRLVKKIKCLKDIGEDDISRFALTSTQDLNKLSIDMHAPLKEQVMASVAIHKCLSGTIADFKNKFPDWNKSVPKVLKQKKKKRKLVIETNGEGNNKSLNKQSIVNKFSKDIEQSESEKEDDKDDNESENEVQELSEEESEQSCNDEQNKDDSVQSDKSEEDTKKNNQNSLSDDESNFRENYLTVVKSDEESESDRLNSEKMRNKKPKKPLLAKNNSKLTKPVTDKHSDDENDKVSNARKNVESSNKSANKKITEKVVDPFFVTSTNEEYVTSQVPSVNDDSQSRWGARNKHFEARESNKFQKNFRNWDPKESYKSQRKFSKFESQPYNKPTFNHFNKGFENNKFSATNRLIIGNRKERRKALHQPLPEEKPEKLHPSWEAKKKLSTIASFQGKKITFD